MISTAHLAAFVLSSFVLIAIPGPSVFFTAGRALVLGRRGGIASAAGNSVGAFTQAVAGAAYLVRLGVQAIRNRRSFAAATTGAVRITSARRAAREAFVVGLTNPRS